MTKKGYNKSSKKIDIGSLQNSWNDYVSLSKTNYHVIGQNKIMDYRFD